MSYTPMTVLAHGNWPRAIPKAKPAQQLGNGKMLDEAQRGRPIVVYAKLRGGTTDAQKYWSIATAARYLGVTPYALRYALATSMVLDIPGGKTYELSFA